MSGRRPTHWLFSVAGGSFLALTVLLFLAWIQPVADEDKPLRSLPQFRFKIRAPEQKPPPPPRENKVERETKPKRKPPRKKRTIARTPQQRVVRKPASPARRLAPAGLQGIRNIDLGAGGFGGGPAINIESDLQFEEVAAETLDLIAYDRQRQRIRERIRDREAQFASQQTSMAIKSEAMPVHTPQPKYPTSARDKEIEGFVLMELLISRTGEVEDHTILNAQPPGVFDQAIADILSRWQFRPAKDKQGRPIESWLKYNYVFRLEDAQ